MPIETRRTNRATEGEGGEGSRAEDQKTRQSGEVIACVEDDDQKGVREGRGAFVVAQDRIVKAEERSLLLKTGSQGPWRSRPVDFDKSLYHT